MKTSKIITAIISLNLILLMSVTSIAYPTTNTTGDIVKAKGKNYISGRRSELSSSTFESTFHPLRFDVNTYISESKTNEVLSTILEILRFDVNNYMRSSETEISEMPILAEFENLRFDVKNYLNNEDADHMEMPENEFSHLRFDVAKSAISNPMNMDELPIAE